MARVAFVMDRLLRKIGLSGRSFVPMLIGFGCSVPAIMATRTLASDRDRKMTILLTPFMSCSAKIPIYAVFCAAFFARYQALVMIGLYGAGIDASAVLVALILKGHRVSRRTGSVCHGVAELPHALAEKRLSCTALGKSEGFSGARVYDYSAGQHR